MGGVTYGTGALVAAERNNRRMWALHAGYLTEEVIPAVPAPVLAEAWRGESKASEEWHNRGAAALQPRVSQARLARSPGPVAAAPGWPR
jgi:hypothetical protein